MSRLDRKWQSDCGSGPEDVAPTSFPLDGDPEVMEKTKRQ